MQKLPQLWQFLHSSLHESGDCTQDSTAELKGKEPAASTIEHKYSKPRTSHCDSCHKRRTQGKKSVVVDQQPTLSLSNVYNQTASSTAHLDKDSDCYYQFLSPCQSSSTPNPTDTCQESLCCWYDGCVTPLFQMLNFREVALRP